MSGSVKHRIHATPSGMPRVWDWWAICGRCGTTEWWDTWELATWYLELHMRATHA